MYRSVYFAVVTLVGVGYGDISPQTNTERVLAIFVMILGCERVYPRGLLMATAIFMATTLGAVSAVIAKLEERSLRKTEVLTDIKSFITMQDVPSEILLEVGEYVDFYWMKHKGLQARDVFSMLPNFLRTKVSFSIFGKDFQSTRLFGDFEVSFIEELCTLCEQVVALEGQVMASQGDRVPGFYIVRSGTILLKSMDGKLIYSMLDSGTFFGEQTVFLGTSWPYTAQCGKRADMLFVSHEALESVLRLFPHCAQVLRERSMERIERLVWVLQKKNAAGTLVDADYFRYRSELMQAVAGNVDDPKSVGAIGAVGAESRTTAADTVLRAAMST